MLVDHKERLRHRGSMIYAIYRGSSVFYDRAYGCRIVDPMANDILNPRVMVSMIIDVGTLIIRTVDLSTVIMISNA